MDTHLDGRIEELHLYAECEIII